jgi:hypothetical protein
MAALFPVRRPSSNFAPTLYEFPVRWEPNAEAFLQRHFGPSSSIGVLAGFDADALPRPGKRKRDREAPTEMEIFRGHD